MKYTDTFHKPALLVLLAAIVAFFPACSNAGELPDTILSSDGVKMRLIPGGTFVMGSNDSDIKETSRSHKLYIDVFYMDEHLVTNSQFAKFINALNEPAGKESSRYKWIVIRDDLEDKDRKGWWPAEITYEFGKHIAYEGFEAYPVMTVSWEGADKYCKWAGKRLPTEAEWEKAARGGQKLARFSWGNALPTEGIVYNRKWDNNEDPPPLEIAMFSMPNKYGMYNMSGMLWEWSNDWFAPDYYKKSPKKNPKGPESGELKILKGGSWFNAANILRVALRNFIPPDALDETTGFRCAKNITESQLKK